MIGWDVRNEVFPHVDPIGRSVKIRGKPFRIIGTMERQGRAFGQSQDNFVAVPLAAFEKAFGANRSVDLFVEARDDRSRPEVEDAVRVVLRSRRGTPFEGRTFWLYMLLYAVSRFIIEFFRGDERGTVGMFSTSQFISLILAPLAVIMLVYLSRAVAPEPKRARKAA